MLIAILSDTHDHDTATRAALKILEPYKPAVYIHAGDLVEVSMLEHFAHIPPDPFHFVFGNNEFEHAELFQRAAELKLTCHGRFADLTLMGKRIAVTHGHEHALLDRLVFSRKYDYLIHGHTHVRRDERINTTRIINPGALHRAKKPSVAILNLATDNLEFLTVQT